MYIDTHCHLDFPDYDGDRAAVLDSAAKAGVTTQISICTTTKNADAVRALSSANPSVYHSAGIHPCHVDEGLFSLEELLARAAHPRCVGLGETGLDFFHNKDAAHINLQRESFRRHMAASQETNLPVIVHSRDCDEITVEELERSFAHKKFPFVIHCFTGSLAFAEAVLRLGGYISVSGIVTFKSASALRNVLETVPLERLLIETDAPYLAPGKYRGKRNEPAFVAETARALAALKGVSLEELAATTAANARRLFTKLPQHD